MSGFFLLQAFISFLLNVDIYTHTDIGIQGWVVGGRHKLIAHPKMFALGFGVWTLKCLKKDVDESRALHEYRFHLLGNRFFFF